MTWSDAFAQTAGAPQAGPNDALIGQVLSFAPIILMFLILYFLMIRPQQERQRKTTEMLRQLKEIGCRRIYFGVESGSQKVLDRMQKEFQVAEIYRASELTKAAGIERGFFLMFGYLDEKHEDVRMTRRVVLDLVPEFAGFSVAYPLKGTPFYEEVKHQMPQQAHWTATNENRVLWASNWPHPGGTPATRRPDVVQPFRRVDDGLALDRMGRWVRDPGQWQKLLVDNAARLYGF